MISTHIDKNTLHINIMCLNNQVGIDCDKGVHCIVKVHNNLAYFKFDEASVLYRPLLI